MLPLVPVQPWFQIQTDQISLSILNANISKSKNSQILTGLANGGQPIHLLPRKVGFSYSLGKRLSITCEEKDLIFLANAKKNSERRSITCKRKIWRNYGASLTYPQETKRAPPTPAPRHIFHAHARLPGGPFLAKLTLPSTAAGFSK